MFNYIIHISILVYNYQSILYFKEIYTHLYYVLNYKITEIYIYIYIYMLTIEIL